MTNAALPAADSMASTIVSSPTSPVTGTRGQARQARPVDDVLVRVGVDHGDARAALGQDGRQDSGGGCFSTSALGRTERDHWHEIPSSSPATVDAERLPKS